MALGSHGYDVAFADGGGGVVDEEVVVDCVVLGGGCVSTLRIVTTQGATQGASG